MPAPEYSLPDTLERLYNNQLALEAAIMELTCWSSSKAIPKLVRTSVVLSMPLARTRGTSGKGWPSWCCSTVVTDHRAADMIVG